MVTLPDYSFFNSKRKILDPEKKKKLRRKRVEFARSCKKSCYLCGEKDKEKLTFHHLSNKAFDLGDARDYGMGRIKAEIEKCIVLCRSCHDIVEQT